MNGVVKFFNEEKRFGFIKADNGGKEYFFHESGLIVKVSKDDRVTFGTKEGKKGEMAFDVKLED